MNAFPSPGKEIDTLVREAVFASDEIKEKSRRQILDLALTRGIFPASIDSFYEARSRGLHNNMTVPAINIRGITYEAARAVFRAALEHRVGAFIFEIARSEIDYTKQRPAEYTACVLAAGIKEGFTGPVFIQGDHFQVNRNKYHADPDSELKAIRELIADSIKAAFFNIDIDASTIVNLEKPSLEEQQELNSKVTAEMTKFIRSIQPRGITISVGGEIGEVGKKNSTPEDLRAFMSGYLKLMGKGTRGISKISVQTGTKHGGVVLPDGTIAQVEIDFKTLEQLSLVARQEYSMAGAVQHGASTLPDEAFDMFPRARAAEIHLATGFQNIIYDSPHFPRKLLEDIHRHLGEKYSNEREPKDTEEQFIYKTRKKAFGDFKKELWSLPTDVTDKLRDALQERFALLFKKLNVIGSADVVKQYVGNRTPTSVSEN